MLNVTLGQQFATVPPLLTELFPALAPVLPYVAVALPFILGIIALTANGRLREFARETVAAVYRVAIHTAAELQDEGLEWLRSEEGIRFRKGLAERAYDALPARVGPVPVGLVKLLVSRERFCALVEAAFQEMASLAERIELPEEMPESWLR